MEQKKHDLWTYQKRRSKTAAEFWKLEKSKEGTGLARSLFAIVQIFDGGSQRRKDAGITKRQEVQEVVKETEWEEARGKEEEDAWRLEPEGETEVLKTVIVADEVEGTCVDSGGEGHHGRGRVKNHRSHSGVPGEKGEEIKSPKRKTIRIESEETQGYARESKEHGSGRSGRTNICTECNQCFAKADVSLRQSVQRKKTVSFWQLASVVIREGGESKATNICQKRRKTLTNCQWRHSAEQKAHRGRLWKKMGKHNSHEKCGRLRKKNRQEYKAGDRWNRQPKNTWSKLNAVMTLVARRNDEEGLDRPEKWRLARIEKHFQG